MQLAKLAGLRVIATTSGANVAMVKSLGADEVIDYGGQDVAAKVQGVDLVIDTIKHLKEIICARQGRFAVQHRVAA